MNILVKVPFHLLFPFFNLFAMCFLISEGETRDPPDPPLVGVRVVRPPFDGFEQTPASRNRTRPLEPEVVRHTGGACALVGLMVNRIV